jgi:hypothetical protein
MGGLNMSLHMILNMPAVLSIHKIGKRERERERERVRVWKEAHDRQRLGAPN